MYISRVTIPQGADAGAGSLAALLRAASERAHDSHRLIWSLFSGDRSADRDFLYRLDDTPHGKQFLVVSAREPANDHGLFRIETKPYDPPVEAGQRLQISLRANPAVNRRALSGEGSRRQDVVKAHVEEAEAAGERVDWDRAIHEGGLDWLRSKGRRHGFAVEDVRPDGYRRIPARKDGRAETNRMMGVLDFDGVVTVTNANAFRHALRTGIGRGKAFGLGLLLAKPV